MRRATRASALVVLVVLVAACAHAPPDRIAYNSIDGAVSAVQGAMQAFNTLYQAGKYTEADRTKVLDAYKKFQAAAQAAIVMSRDATQGATALQLVTDAAAQALLVINAFK